jgi:hypothetical protein
LPIQVEREGTKKEKKMRPTFQLTPDEKIMYADKKEFKEFYRLKLELVDLFNTYIDREVAKYGYTPINNALQEILYEMEKHWEDYQRVGFQVRFPDTLGEH